MKELDACLRDLVAAVRAAYQPTLAHDALVRATIVELTQLEEPASPVPVRGSSSTLHCVRVVPNAAPAPITVSPATEQAVIGILTSANGEHRISEAFDRKEAELRAVFCALRPLEAAALRKRLAEGRPDDKLADEFSRFATERRMRLLAVLADARRREALQSARARVSRATVAREDLARRGAR